MNKDTVELLHSLSDETVAVTASTNGIIKFQRDDVIITVKILTKDDMSMEIMINDVNVHNIVLKGIMKTHNISFSTIDQLYDFTIYVKDTIQNLTRYCVGCYQILEFQSEEYITCGNEECDYKLEELNIGNPVIDKIKEDRDIVEFLIESAIDAIKCNRRSDIFEPFPKHFLKNSSVQIKRGEMSKLTSDISVGAEYDAAKDFNRLNSIIDKFTIKNFFDIVDTCYDDAELIKMIGDDMYKLIRFIIMSSKIQLVKDNDLLNVPIDEDGHYYKLKNVLVYKILHPVDKEKEFKTVSADKVLYLFHGSNWHNWHSIMRNGLKNCSNTKLMTAGAAYGNGIYLSSEFGYSFNYGRSGSKSVVGVFELANNFEKNPYHKGGNIYVVTDEKMLIQRYLIISPSQLQSEVTTHINKIFTTVIHSTKSRTQTRVLTKGIKKLVKEYKRLKKVKSIYGFRIEVDPSNMYLWKVYIFGYDKNEAISKDMAKYGVNEIEIDVKFPENYPFSPPFLRVIRPRFQHLTGHVTSGGALCMQVLTEKYWDPACSMESLIISIKSEILEGGGRLDPNNFHMPYSEKEAVESFQRVSRGHGWL